MTVKIGMSAPDSEWSARLKEVGGSVDSRRVFGQLSSPDSAINTAKAALLAREWPIISFKIPNNDWSGAANGKFDAAIRTIANTLGNLGGKVFVTLHHEPMGDGTPQNYAAMLTHCLPLLAVNRFVRVGPIVNGFWWSNQGQKLSDSEIAQWLPQSVLNVSPIIGADCYQGGTTTNPGENAGVKIKNMSAWAKRHGVQGLGIGEYNGLDAASIKAAGDAALADPAIKFASCFNSNVNNRAGVSWLLTGARLTAFKNTLAASRA